MGEINEFILIDQNKLLNPLFKHYDLTYVIHELLSFIDEELDILIKYNIKKLDNLNFDNYLIINVLNCNNKRFEIVIQKYNFNIKNLTLYNKNQSEIIDVTNLVNLNGLVESIVNKRNTICKNSIISEPVFIKKNKPTVNLLKETTDLVNKLSSKSNHTASLISNQATTEHTEIRHQMGTIVQEKPLKKPNVEIVDDCLENMDSEELKKTLESLTDLKKIEDEKLNKLKEQNKNDLDNFSVFYEKLSDKRRKFTFDKEKAEENMRIFKSDIGVYRKMKQDIEDIKLLEENISPLFKKKFPIFKILDDKNLLDSEDSYLVYLNLYESVSQSEKSMESLHEYVPHNIYYLDKTEQEKYENIKSIHKDIIEDFINQNRKNKDPKKYPPIEEILSNINNENGEINDEFTNVDFENYDSEVHKNIL